MKEMMNQSDDGEDEIYCTNGRAPGRHMFTLNELLSMIDLIRKQPLIWDKDHPEYNYGLSRAIAFEHIAQELQIPVDDIRWKWQILRKEYFKKAANPKKMANGKYQARPWKWAMPLSFLAPMYRTLSDKSATPTEESSLQRKTPLRDNKGGSSLLASNHKMNANSDSDSTDIEYVNGNCNEQDGNEPSGGDDDAPDDDNDESEPKFYCETTYSHSSAMEDEDVKPFQVPIEPGLSVKRLMNHNNNGYKRLRRDIVMSERLTNGHINETNSILDFLKQQNIILLNRAQKEEILSKQLFQKYSEISTLLKREERWTQKLQDPFYAYVTAKLSLLQDVPRNSKWIECFQSEMDRAFQNVYRKHTKTDS